MACPECAASFHSECQNGVDGFCCCTGNIVGLEDVVKSLGGGQVKSPSEITDIESTGRKRAALLYPIMEGQVCDWANLYYCGGGTTPIIGCAGNLASDIHHGPDKNTINNGPTNVHRICAVCHNRWHARNDSYYPNPRPSTNVAWLPVVDFKFHDPDTKATEHEIMLNEIWFGLKKKTKTYEEFRKELEDARSGRTGHSEEASAGTDV